MGALLTSHRTVRVCVCRRVGGYHPLTFTSPSAAPLPLSPKTRSQTPTTSIPLLLLCLGEEGVYLHVRRCPSHNERQRMCVMLGETEFMNLGACVCVSKRDRGIKVWWVFFCLYPGGEREIHRRQLCRGICSKRLYGSLGNRARMREWAREGGREWARDFECVCVYHIVGK